MDSLITPSLSQSASWRAYRKAFEAFSRAVREVQELRARPHPDRAAIEIALLELELARVAYNDRRDVVADQLLRSPRKTGKMVSESPEARLVRVREIAKLLWEVSGQPEGTAEEDWYRAEKILRRAAAA